MIGTIKHSAAKHVGNIHRILTEAIDPGSWEQLQARLLSMNLDALEFVCIDLNVLPENATPQNRASRSALASALVSWVSHLCMCAYGL